MKLTLLSKTLLSQGHQGRQGPQGLGLAWILQNRKWRQQCLHAADLATTVAALPAKNWPWGDPVKAGSK